MKVDRHTFDTSMVDKFRPQLFLEANSDFIMIMEINLLRLLFAATLRANNITAVVSDAQSNRKFVSFTLIIGRSLDQVMDLKVLALADVCSVVVRVSMVLGSARGISAT